MQRDLLVQCHGIAVHIPDIALPFLQPRHKAVSVCLREVFSSEGSRRSQKDGEAPSRVIPEHPPPAAERLPDREQQPLPGLLGSNLQHRHSSAGAIMAMDRLDSRFRQDHRGRVSSMARSCRWLAYFTTQQHILRAIVLIQRAPSSPVLSSEV